MRKSAWAPRQARAHRSAPRYRNRWSACCSSTRSAPGAHLGVAVFGDHSGHVEGKPDGGFDCAFRSAAAGTPVPRRSPGHLAQPRREQAARGVALVGLLTGRESSAEAVVGMDRAQLVGAEHHAGGAGSGDREGRAVGSCTAQVSSAASPRCGVATMRPGAVSQSSHGLRVTGRTNPRLRGGSPDPEPDRIALGPPLFHWGSRGRRFKSCRPDGGSGRCPRKGDAALTLVTSRNARRRDHGRAVRGRRA